MSHAAVIGEPLPVVGYALAGALVFPAASRDAALAAWHALPPDVAVVILTSTAASWLDPEIRQRPEILSTVLPS